MWRRVVSVWTDVSEDRIASSETSVDTETIQRHIPENGILHSHRRENLNSYIQTVIWCLLWTLDRYFKHRNNTKSCKKMCFYKRHVYWHSTVHHNTQEIRD
jgi:hypothetical protein